MKLFRYILTAFILISTLSVQAQTLESIPPTVVQGVTVIEEDGLLRFSWEAATDEDGIIDHYKMYYGTSSVQTIDDAYDAEINVGNVLSYALENLENNSTYYVAFTAVDDEGNESENYSLEVSGTPQGEPSTSSDADDGEKPKVIMAEYYDLDVVKVMMSEEVIGANTPAAVSIIEKDTGEYIDVIAVETKIDEIFVSVAPNTVFLGQSYDITVNSIVTDLEGNPVSSGITDTVEFTATEITPSECENNIECFMTNVKKQRASTVEANYTVDYFEKIDQLHNADFSHTQSDNGEWQIEIKLDTTQFEDESINIGLGAQNICLYDSMNNVELFFSEVERGNVHADTLFQAFVKCDVYDEFGTFEEMTQMGEEGLELVKDLVNILSTIEEPTISEDPFGENETLPENTEETEMNTPYSSAPDTIAPLDVTNLDVHVSNGSATIIWIEANDIDEDIADQIVYIKKESESSYDEGISIGTGTNSLTINVEEDESYEVKVVTIDITGNESYGRSTTFTTSLNKSGASTTLLWVIALIFGIGFLKARRNS